MIMIDKGVPLPPSRKGLSKYPWKDMAVGDSVFIQNAIRTTLLPQVYRAARRYGIKFTARTCSDGVRVWRIA